MGLLHLLEQIPDYLYPIPERIGLRVSLGKKAYDYRLNICVQKFGGIEGAQRHCSRLIIWREICHFVGALAFISFLHLFVVPVNMNVALGISALYAVFFLWQEYYFQPRVEHLKQIPFKANLDVAVWCVPVLIYLATVLLW